MAWRRGLGIADDELAVMFLGRIVLEKALDVFAGTIAGSSSAACRTGRW